MSKSAKPDLNAGPFGSWLDGAIDAIEGRREANVPCGDCTACCQSSQFIHVNRDETRPLSLIPKELLFPAPGGPPGSLVMGYDQAGRCPMLLDNRCSIYAHRPATCRSYDCRIFPAAGICAEDNENAKIAEQAERWRFEYPTEADRRKHQAVKAAARFLRGHPELFARRGAANATQLAVFAIKIHAVFLDQAAGDDPLADEGKVLEAIRQVRS